MYTEKRTCVKEDRTRSMMSRLQAHSALHHLLIAALLAVCLALVLPGTSEAHAILLRSDPAKDAVLSVAPDQVRLWFSEALNPAFSTTAVVNEANQRVDRRDAFVSPNDATEMDVSLRPNLTPGVYVVVWRTDSADDGHVLTGSFLFTLARLDGSVPTLSGGIVLGQNALGGSNATGQDSGQLDGLALFNLLMITLVELGAVFWVGAQFWPIFVLLPSAEDHEELSASNQQAQQRFERRFSLPTLLLLLLANFGVLLGQALTVTGGNVANAFAPTLLVSLVTNGRFGTFWIMRVIVIVLALRLSLYQLQLYRSRRSLPRLVNTVLPWANLLLGLALFIAMTMSSHASAVGGSALGRGHALHRHQLLANSPQQSDCRAGTLTRHRAALLFTLGPGGGGHHGGYRPAQRHDRVELVGAVVRDGLRADAGRQGAAGRSAAPDQRRPRSPAPTAPEKIGEEVCLCCSTSPGSPGNTHTESYRAARRAGSPA